MSSTCIDATKPCDGLLERAILPCLFLAVLAALCAGPAGLMAQDRPARTAHLEGGSGFAAETLATQYRVPQTQEQIESVEEPRKPLPEQIESMPPIQEELEVIAGRSQLIVARHGIMRTAIADPSVVDIVQYSPTEISIIGMAIGATTLTLWFDNAPQNPLIYLIKTVPDDGLEENRRIDFGKLERKLQVLFPNSTVYLIPLSRKIIVKGQAHDSEEAAKILQIVRGEVIDEQGGLYYGGNGSRSGAPSAGGYTSAVAPVLGAGDDNNVTNDGFYSSLIVNMLEVPGEFEVLVRVRIAELDREMLRRWGVDINVLFNDARHLLSSTLGAVPGTLSGIFENGEIDIAIDALESNGSLKILAEPAVAVLSGHPASFLAGGEFAVPTIIGINGAQGQGTTFRGFGTSVIVTPTVLDKDLFRLQIIPEFSQINTDNAVQGIPGLDTRRVQTTVELREGQTIAIAGLFSHQTNVENSRIPLLGEIPYIGPKLFSAKKATQDQSELLILVTPELVRPMDPEDVPPVPGSEVTWPSHDEFYRYNMTEGSPDTGYYQIPPLGRGSGHGVNVGYRVIEPVPPPNYGPGTMGGGGGYPGAPPAYGAPPYPTAAPPHGHSLPSQGYQPPGGSPMMPHHGFAPPGGPRYAPPAHGPGYGPVPAGGPPHGPVSNGPPHGPVSNGPPHGPVPNGPGHAVPQTPVPPPPAAEAMGPPPQYYSPPSGQPLRRAAQPTEGAYPAAGHVWPETVGPETPKPTWRERLFGQRPRTISPAEFTTPNAQ